MNSVLLKSSDCIKNEIMLKIVHSFLEDVFGLRKESVALDSFSFKIWKSIGYEKHQQKILSVLFKQPLAQILNFLVNYSALAKWEQIGIFLSLCYYKVISQVFLENGSHSWIHFSSSSKRTHKRDLLNESKGVGLIMWDAAICKGYYLHFSENH